MSDDIHALRQALAPPPPPGPLPPPVVQEQRIQFASGIAITGPVYRRVGGRLRVLYAAAQSNIRVENGAIKFGALAGPGIDYWSAPTAPVIPYHTKAATRYDGGTFVLTQPTIVAKHRGELPGDPRCLEEAVLILPGPPADLPALAAWPSVITGATPQDMDDFLASTDVRPETHPGWPSRYGQASLNEGPSDEPGYGGVFAERTSFGALLLVSNLGPMDKKRIQDRMIEIGDDLELWGRRYGANGGHSNGRYFPWLVRSALRGATSLPGPSFSEEQQAAPFTGPGNLQGLGFVHTEGQAPTMTNPSATERPMDYFNCCTFNRTNGAAMAAALVPWLAPKADWVRMSKLALDLQDRTAPATTRWFTVKHARSAALIYANRAALGW